MIVKEGLLLDRYLSDKVDFARDEALDIVLSFVKNSVDSHDYTYPSKRAFTSSMDR